MTPAQLANSPCGRLVPTDWGQKAFVPRPLPRSVDLSTSMVIRLDEASRAVATLAGVGETIPNPYLLANPFMSREAVLSSRIEGTQASLSDLFLYEASGSRRPKNDVIEVVNYIKALNEGIELLVKLPISLRLINRMHSVLLAGVRGEEKRPGEFRTKQVWIGSAGTPIEEAKFIPPPASFVVEAMADWERFVNERSVMPPLIQCALMHYQFEAIHPYMDGNGRIGRLLIVLFLCERKVLPVPLLYLSAYFEADRQKYYDQLYRLSATGDWGRWLEYFLKGVVEQAHDALNRARRVRVLQETYRARLQELRASGNSVRLVDELFERPYMTAPQASRLLGVTVAGARGILDRLQEAGIVASTPGTWPRVYVARELFDVIHATAEPSVL